MTHAQLTADWLDSMPNDFEEAKEQETAVMPTSTYIRRRVDDGGDVYDVRVAAYGKPHQTMGTLINRGVAERLARVLAARYQVPFVDSILGN